MMIKLKDILDEKITDVKWVDKAYKFAMDDKFPLTPKIGAILNEKKRVRAFHITTPNARYLTKLASLQGTKKSISCMTNISYMDAAISGVHHEGAMFYLEGTLIVRDNHDIMSVPDEQGRRWFSISNPNLRIQWKYVLSNNKNLIELKRKLYDAAFKDTLTRRNPDTNELYRNTIKLIVDLAEEFAKEYADVFRTIDASEIGMLDSWDELILNEIELIDVIYDTNNIPTDNLALKAMITKKLKSMVSGKVYSVDSRLNPYDAQKEANLFMSSRKAEIKRMLK